MSNKVSDTNVKLQRSGQLDERSKESRVRADQLEERLIDFAVRIMNIAASLPRNAAGRHIAGQILRSGTSPAPNYGEARGAESRADFIHKTRVVVKELNETSIWLRMIDRGKLLKHEAMIEVMDENRQLCKIFAATISTSKRSR